MMILRQHIVPLFFMIEICILVLFYLFGQQGLPILLALKQENNQLTQEIQNIELQITDLQKTIDTWNTSPFYQEKVAREQLQMARPDDEVIIHMPEKQGN